MMTPLESAIFREINRRRVMNGKKPLSRNEAGDYDARNHSTNMASEGRLFHTSGGTFGENVLSMTDTSTTPFSDDGLTAIHAADSWMNSLTGHRENLLNTSYLSSGVGVYKSSSDGTLYITQRFYTKRLPQLQLPPEEPEPEEPDTHRDRWAVIEV